MAKLPHFNAVKDHVMIRGYSLRVQGLANSVEIRDVISALRLDHCDPGGREITDIGNFQRRNPNITVRLDRQANTSGGAANLQVQVNATALSRVRLNQNEGTTIAQVIVPAGIYRSAVNCPEINVRAHLENVVRSALLQSVESFGFQYTIVEG
jgi:hypothetical protein